ncbi:MAG: DUF2326 domain-containing protein [Candidatus Hydrogenedentes bacterium]|nr:DUF2326 domain-containing protein [Candidatus Hydrogenedentota bacterium]
MRLISLAASEPSFKTVNFNRSGPSFILAKQAHPEQHDKSKTYNGVGKSLIVALIDYCLGAKSSTGISKALREGLPNWSFILTLEIENRDLEIVRRTSAPETIQFDGQELGLKAFNTYIEGLCFDIPPEVGGISFRALLPYFLRPSRKSYLSYDQPVRDAKPYFVQLYNAFLLGLDVGLAQAKMHVKTEFEEVRKLHESVKKDPILRQFFEGHRDSTLAIADLNDQITSLEWDLQKFEIADDYYQVKASADNIKRTLDSLQNELLLKRISVDNIDRSSKITPDLKRADIQRIYDESRVVFQADVERQLSELEKFYNDLTTNRVRRLEIQKRTILDDIKRLEEKSSALKREFDNVLKYLDTHQALDVFVKMSSRLTDLQYQREKIQAFEKLQHDYDSKKTSLKREMLSQVQEAADYLEQVKPKIERVMESFRALAKRFYPSASAGVTVTSNKGENQIRFQIEAKIQSDSSDGINSVKLFCYDLTLLTVGHNHSMHFVFHDSRLFSDIDEVHSDVLFNIVKDKFTEASQLQYIASINQNQLTSLSGDCREFIAAHVVLELTDDSNEGKLLGETVELEYDE